ncbi:MAG: ABC transporter ATP-binding protein [Oscillospiraceae bacterium]|nr:ABC transporter ATP-binding protein [Oscillospiraceae bacterium]
MDILTIRDVSKSFGSHQVLKNLSLSVPEHKVYGFIGCNGAGKTTTMKMILGLYTIDSGSIEVCGQKVTYGQTQTNRNIGYLPDVPEFYDFMTPYEYLDLCADITEMSVKGRKEKINSLLGMTGLDIHKKRIHGFSRGMKQRLGIAQALLNEPKLLICDEPTSALDPLGRKEILDILTQATDRTTVLFSTHILTDVERICDEVGFLKNGSVVYQSAIQDIKNSHASHGFSIEFPNQTECDRFSKLFGAQNADTEISGKTKLIYKKQNHDGMLRAMKIMSDNHLCPVSIQQIEPDLEEMFMEVIG